MSERPGDEGLAAATRLLGDATDLMCNDIYIVDPSRHVPSRATRENAWDTLIAAC